MWALGALGGRWPCYYNSTCLSTSGTGAPACFAAQLYRESCKKFLTTHNNQVMFDIRYKHNIFCMPCLICQENISRISRNHIISLQNWICNSAFTYNFMITTIFVVMLTIGHGGTGKHGENDGHGLDADNGGPVKPVGQAGHGIHGGLMDYGGLTMADI